MSQVNQPSEDSDAPPSGNGVRLLVQLLALGAIVGLSLLAIVYFIPDGNDYPLATIDKHDRLAETDKPKIVFVGGSNLAYGLDSPPIAQATGRHVVNMGMNGYLGVRFMLEEIKPSLRSGDLVVIALEYDSFYKTVDGSGRDLLMIVKTRPASLPALTASQLWEVAGMVPYAAQKKALRLVRTAFKGIKGEEEDAEPVTADAIVASVETHDGFNEYGDLQSHLKIDWQYGREPGLDLTKLGIDPEVVGVLQAFSEDMNTQGIKVVMSYSPLLRSFYNEHRETIADLHQRMTNAKLTLPLPPEAFVYDEPLFFDTVYHLNAKGRQIRTQKLIECLKPYLQAEPS